MPLKRDEVKRIREKEADIYSKISLFLLQNEEMYFSAEEIAKNLNMDVRDVEEQLSILYFNLSEYLDAVYFPEEGVKRIVDKIEKNGREYFAFIKI